MTATQLLPTMVLEIADDCDCCAACKATRLLSQQATIITAERLGFSKIFFLCCLSVSSCLHTGMYIVKFVVRLIHTSLSVITV